MAKSSKPTNAPAVGISKVSKAAKVIFKPARAIQFSRAQATKKKED